MFKLNESSGTILVTYPNKNNHNNNNKSTPKTKIKKQPPNIEAKIGRTITEVTDLGVMQDMTVANLAGNEKGVLTVYRVK